MPLVASWVSEPTPDKSDYRTSALRTPDGSVAWLDDARGSVAGHYDVWLDGLDLSQMDGAIDEGPVLRLLPDGTRVVAWDDETNVWVEHIPAPR